MRLFNAKILDEVLEGDGAVGECNLAWEFLLPRAESLKFTCIVDEVTDATATLTLVLADDSGAEVLLVPGLSIPNTFSSAFSPLDSLYPPTRNLIVVAQLNGTNGPKGRVRVWACGRGPQSLEVAPPPTSFAAQYQIARLIEDEDRIAARKRVLKLGASSGYVPEQFYPSLKWER